MKGITLLLALIIIAPMRVIAQGTISVGGVVAFYQPALDEIKEPYEESTRNGDIVDKLTGSFLFGGFIGYHPSAKLGIRLRLAYWSEEASIDNNNNIDVFIQEQKIRVIPIMLDGQYYIGQPKSLVRLYFGSGIGVVLIEDQVNTQIGFTSWDGTTMSIETFSNKKSFWEFSFRPFVGAEFFSANRFTIFSEVGYMISKYPVLGVETTDDGFALILEDVSLNGLETMVGLKLNF